MAKIEMLWDHLDDIRWKDQWVEWMKPAHVQPLLFQFLGGGEGGGKYSIVCAKKNTADAAKQRTPPPSTVAVP